MQDEYLRVTASGGHGKPWFLLGKRFGPKCCLAVLGVGNSRFARIGQGKMDRRFGVWGGVPCWKVSLFLTCSLGLRLMWWKLWWKVILT